MPEHSNSTQMTEAAARPFPWPCPKCRRKEVRRTTISYQCQRVFHNQPVTISVTELAVPQCGHCGELVFDYEAEEQLNRAYKSHLATLVTNSD